MTKRDWIPEGGELTPEERKAVDLNRISIDPEFRVKRDFIPAEGEVLVDRTVEEKSAFAEQAAGAEVDRYDERLREHAARTLPGMTEAEVQAFLANLSDHDREVYLQVEKDGRNRNRLFALFGNPPEREEPMPIVGGVDTEIEDTPSRGPEHLPLASHSPSDIVQRLHARQEAQLTAKEKEERQESLAVEPSEAGVPLTAQEEANSAKAREAAGLPAEDVETREDFDVDKEAGTKDAVSEPVIEAGTVDASGDPVDEDVDSQPGVESKSLFPEATDNGGGGTKKKDGEAE